MTSEPAIRMARPSDASAVVACVAAAYEMYRDRMGTPPAPVLDDYDALISQGVVHVAELRDQVVGLIVMWDRSDHFYIDNVAVDPHVQGRGLGGLLLRYADAAARRAGKDELRLYTNVLMVENIDYYLKHGYRETNRSMDQGYDRVFFTRILRPPPSSPNTNPAS